MSNAVTPRLFIIRGQNFSSVLFYPRLYREAIRRNLRNVRKRWVFAQWVRNKIFKQGIGIAEKSQEARRDHWGVNVNHKSLF